MVLATIGLGAAAGIAPFDLARLANVAGGLEVEQIGVVPITRQQILADLFTAERLASDKICTLDVLERHVAARRRLGKRDRLHQRLLRPVAHGARNLSPAGRPRGGLPHRRDQQRCERAAAWQGARSAHLRRTATGRHAGRLEAVDYVTIFSEPTPHALLGALKPDLLVKGGTYCPQEIVGRELVEEYGGQVKALGEVPGVSTTRRAGTGSRTEGSLIGRSG